LAAGRTPRERDPDALTVADLCNEYCTYQEERRDEGEISPRTFQGLHATCANIIDALGKRRAVSDLTPDDFGKLKTQLRKTRGAVSLRNEMQRCRSVFRYAFVNGLIDRDVRYGSKFDKPALKQVRKNRREHREKHGDRMFEAEEVRQVLAEAKQPLKAMVLLAVNCGFGQTDLARLPISSVDLDGAIIDFPRPKTEASRLCPLWPETVDAVREWTPQRPKAKDKVDESLLFLTCRGARFVKTGETGMSTDGIGQEFGKVLRRLGLKRPGVGFYALRHSFRTVADETLDPVAINLIMGHVDTEMASHYRERIGDDRLRRVADHVRAWLLDREEV
jgi:integrase